MNFQLAEALGNLLVADKLDEAIVLAEMTLQTQDPTDFHQLVGKSLLHETDKLTDYVTDFYDIVKDNLRVKAIYAEMNGFTINYDLWFLDLFAYDKVGGTEDTDWLADWEAENSTEHSFPLTGYEGLQATYQDYHEQELYTNEKMQAAGDVAELLIVLRLQELVREATRIARQNNLPWAGIPVFASAHDYYDMVYKAG